MSSTLIPIEEINFHPTSFCDRNARVFWWRKELYRGISPAKVSFYRDLFARGIAQRLIEQKLLVATEITEFTVKDYPLVLKHHLIPFVSYAHEWTPVMLKDCAWLVTKLMLELAKDDLTLADVSTFDMMFDGCQPVFVDFGSLEIADFDGDRTWTRYQADFRDYFITPLKIMAQGHGNLARWLFMDYDHEVMIQCGTLLAGDRPTSSWRQRLKQLEKFLTPANSQRLRVFWSKWQKLSLKSPKGVDLVRKLWREVEEISLTEVESVTEDFTLSPSPSWKEKQRLVYQVLCELKPTTVLDLGCDRGWYSQLAAATGSQVVAIDFDETKITQCYRDAATRNLSVFPLVMNIRNPSPGLGVCNRIVASASERLECELVLALGLVHQLVFEQYLNLEQIAATFATFSERWLLVEFYSEQTKEVKPFWSQRYSWYSLENFQHILAKYFARIELIALASQSSVPRTDSAGLPLTSSKVLLLCKKY